MPPTGVILAPHTTYVWYLRVWYDFVSYAEYVTDGTKSDSTPPELSSTVRVTDLQSALSTSDTDFIPSTTRVTLAWDGVFRDSQSDVIRYVAYVSKNLRIRYVAEKESLIAKTTLEGLTLDNTDRHYSIVVAYNEAGLFRSAYSDGFTVI